MRKKCILDLVPQPIRLAGGSRHQLEYWNRVSYCENEVLRCMIQVNVCGARLDRPRTVGFCMFRAAEHRPNKAGPERSVTLSCLDRDAFSLLQDPGS